jgi:hypothetical protein
MRFLRIGDLFFVPYVNAAITAIGLLWYTIDLEGG